MVVVMMVTCSALLRSGVSEFDIADYQRIQLAVIYLVCFHFHVHFLILV